MKEFKVGNKFDFGETILTENEIIEFAKAFDPLEFHTDIEAAKNSIFKGLVASGPHLFNAVYRKSWIPLFGKTVVCGLGISNWKFFKPVYANHKIFSTLTIVEIIPDNQRNSVAIAWLFEFKNEKGEQVQRAQMEVLHKI